MAIFQHMKQMWKKIQKSSLVVVKQETLLKSIINNCKTKFLKYK